MIQTPPPYCWPGCNPKPGESACSCICRVLAMIEGIRFEEWRRRQMPVTPRHTIYDQGDTGASVGYAAAALVDRLRADQGLCPNCGGGSVRNVWGMTNEDAQCINCGAVFNSFERMREMDQGSN